MRRVFPLILILLLAAGGLIAARVTDSSPHLGLDLQGGISVVLTPTTAVEGGELDQAVSIIRERVDSLGVAEPEITRQGEAVVVQLPGVEDRDRVLELIGSTAELRFRPVLACARTEDAPGPDEMPQQTCEQMPLPGDDVLDLPVPDDLTDPENLTDGSVDESDEAVVLEDQDGTLVYAMGPTMATGQIVDTAQASLDFGQWYVGLSFRSGEEGIDLFNEAATICFSGLPECPTGALAIVLDSVVQSAPTIQEPTFDRSQGATITGDFSEREAKDLARLLRYGALPVEFETQSVEAVSASLGEDSLRAGVVAGLVGLALVAAYMIFYYRALGLVVILGMGVWAALMYSAISWLGVTQGLALTLAGVTGIIISVGVTVDSYVVYFERLKDEVKMGYTLRTSADRAFKRAFRTILAANAATFIGAAVLWWWTVGAVRGFAFFLGLSTVLGVVVTWMFTRPTVTLLARNRFFGEAKGIGLADAVGATQSSAAGATTGGAS